MGSGSLERQQERCRGCTAMQLSTVPFCPTHVYEDIYLHEVANPNII